MTSPQAKLATALSDRYRLERELGQGGMATVYLAEDLKHDRKVAIKVLHPELSAVIGGELGSEHLDGDLPLVAEVVGEVDGGHAALAELVLQPIAVGEGMTQAVRHAHGLLPWSGVTASGTVAWDKVK